MNNDKMKKLWLYIIFRCFSKKPTYFCNVNVVLFTFYFHQQSISIFEDTIFFN